jgi:hypothetical protein
LIVFFVNFIAVQKERDRLGRQRHNYTYRIARIKSIGHINDDLDDEDEDDLSIIALLRAEQTAKEV